MREHKQRTRETLSLTAYVIACLARTVAENPEVNSFRKGRRLITLGDVTVGSFVERELEGGKTPEPFAILGAQSKTYRQIHDEVRGARLHSARARARMVADTFGLTQRGTEAWLRTQ